MRAKNSINNKKGYLLLEIIVSLGIFSIIVTTSIGAVLAIVDANTKSQTTKSVIDNLSVALENISRTVRIGTNYKCLISFGTTAVVGNTCVAGTIGIEFTPQDSASPTDVEDYYFDSSTGAIYRYRASKDTYPGTPLTAPEVNITSMNFNIYGSDVNDGQPRVFITINGQAGQTGKRGSEFSLQTTVTERTPDMGM